MSPDEVKALLEDLADDIAYRPRSSDDLMEFAESIAESIRRTAKQIG